MDSLTTFDPSETSGFITINAIRLKKVSLPRAVFSFSRNWTTGCDVVAWGAGMEC